MSISIKHRISYTDGDNKITVSLVDSNFSVNVLSNKHKVRFVNNKNINKIEFLKEFNAHDLLEYLLYGDKKYAPDLELNCKKLGEFITELFGQSMYEWDPEIENRMMYLYEKLLIVFDDPSQELLDSITSIGNTSMKSARNS